MIQNYGILVPNTLYILCYRKEKQFNESKEFAIGLLERIKNKVTG